MTDARFQWRPILQSVWLPAALLSFWQVASTNAWVNPFFFPPPSSVLATAGAMLMDGEIPRALGITMIRYMAGSLVGAAAGVLCGALMGLSVAGRRAMEPFVAALYATPKLTLLPLLMLLMGLGEAPKMTLIALVGFIFLSTQTMDGIRSVKRSYVEMAENYGAGRWALIRRVYLPAALPQIFTGLRIGFSRSLVVAISLELISGTTGLGGLIWMSWETLATERLYVGILLAALLGIVIHRGFARLETIAVPWRS
jgi:ABC-type nitrate/sulfonate/bicarbonate transport system permease component